jgi:hypothetical protein
MSFLRPIANAIANGDKNGLFETAAKIFKGVLFIFETAEVILSFCNPNEELYIQEGRAQLDDLAVKMRRYAFAAQVEVSYLMHQLDYQV